MSVRLRLAVCALLAVGLLAGNPRAQSPAGLSLRFFGNGENDIDRVKVRIDGPEVPADVGATDVTIEWWMKANPSENRAAAVPPGSINWINGNIIVDRDIWSQGDFGDFGVSLGAGRLAFGVETSAGANTIVGARTVTDGEWHHVAVTRRRADGRLRIYVDGALDADGDGPDGDMSYRNGRSTINVNDPFLVIGAEKHDAGGGSNNSYHGWVDEFRISTVLRYASPFTRPAAPFAADSATALLFHFNEGSGTLITDVSGAAGGPSHGVLRVGGTPRGPEWSTDTPPLGGGSPTPTAPRNLRIVG